MCALRARLSACAHAHIQPCTHTDTETYTRTITHNHTHPHERTRLQPHTHTHTHTRTRVVHYLSHSIIATAQWQRNRAPDSSSHTYTRVHQTYMARSQARTAMCQRQRHCATVIMPMCRPVTVTRQSITAKLSSSESTHVATSPIIHVRGIPPKRKPARVA